MLNVTLFFDKSNLDQHSSQKNSLPPPPPFYCGVLTKTNDENIVF